MSVKNNKEIIQILDVGYTTFEIVYEENMEDKEGLLGETNFDKHQIRIQAGLSDRVLQEVFWHEITHILIEVAGFGGHPEEEDSMAQINNVTNEELVTRTSRILILFFRLNPWLKELI